MQTKQVRSREGIAAIALTMVYNALGNVMYFGSQVSELFHLKSPFSRHAQRDSLCVTKHQRAIPGLELCTEQLVVSEEEVCN